MKKILLSLLLVFVSCDIYASGSARCTGVLEIKNKDMVAPEKKFQTLINHDDLVGAVIKVNECVNHGCVQVGVGNWSGVSSFIVEDKELLKNLSKDQKGVFDPSKLKVGEKFGYYFFCKNGFPNGNTFTWKLTNKHK